MTLSIIWHREGFVIFGPRSRLSSLSSMAIPAGHTIVSRSASQARLIANTIILFPLLCMLRGSKRDKLQYICNQGQQARGYIGRAQYTLTRSFILWKNGGSYMGWSEARFLLSREHISWNNSRVMFPKK